MIELLPIGILPSDDNEAVTTLYKLSLVGEFKYSDCDDCKRRYKCNDLRAMRVAKRLMMALGLMTKHGIAAYSHRGNTYLSSAKILSADADFQYAVVQLTYSRDW